MPEANRRITELTAIDAVANADLVPVVDDVAGTPVTKKATVTQLLASAEKLANKDAANGYPGLDANGDVVLSKIVPASAASRLLGRGSAAGAGDFQEITVGTGLQIVGTEISASGGSGGTTSGLEANRPAGSEGELYFPTNAPYIHRKNASVWQQWGPIFPMTKPVNGDFSWVNQGGATIDDTNGCLTLVCPANASIGWRMRVMTAPATPYTVSACFLAHPLMIDFMQWGLVWRQSSDGKLHVFSIQTNPAASIPFSNSVKYTNETTFSAVYNQRRFQYGNLVWLRLVDNGTNRITYFSMDGQRWWGHSSIGRTDFLTADQIGFAGNPENSTYDLPVQLISWKVE